LGERPFPIGVNLDDMVEASTSQRYTAIKTVRFGVVTQKHEHGTVASRVGQTGTGINIDLAGRKAATNRRNAADLIKLLHPAAGGVLSNRTGGGDESEAPGQKFGQEANTG